MYRNPERGVNQIVVVKRSVLSVLTLGEIVIMDDIDGDSVSRLTTFDLVSPPVLPSVKDGKAYGDAETHCLKGNVKYRSSLVLRFLAAREGVRREYRETLA